MQRTTERERERQREREEEQQEVCVPDSLGLRERRGLVGLRGSGCVVIGGALVLRPDFHDRLFGFIFSAGRRQTARLKPHCRRALEFTDIG